MLGECHEMLAHQRASPRWKEWIPLVTQQLRLRNLIQVVAYNVTVSDKLKSDYKAKDPRLGKMKTSFYYTLHLTTMSAPFYTSEKLENENPKWSEIEVGDSVNSINASVSGIVVRLWAHRSGAAAGAAAGESSDHQVTVWGVSFSGLAYLGPRPVADPRLFAANTLVFHMRGGYFTAPQCQKESAAEWPSKARERRTAVRLPAADVKPSYSVPLVCRLHTIQQAIKKQRAAAAALRERIEAGAPPVQGGGGPSESAVLRRLLARDKLPAHAMRQKALTARRLAEDAFCRVNMLRDERVRATRRVQAIQTDRQRLLDANQDRGLELMNNYQELHKEMERLKDRRKMYLDTRDSYLTTNAQLIFRQKQLISMLGQIYPVQKMKDGEFSICGVHLPSSEDFGGKDEIMVSVSLGYVAHVLQMISFFLQVPLRYPVIHFGSWSKIIDHIVEKIPEKDREFPLFSRGKDKLQFNYGVYLLNKNVAQLRWYCGLPTQDLRTTLPNLASLLHIQAITVTDGPSNSPVPPASLLQPPPLPSEPSPSPPPPPEPPLAPPPSNSRPSQSEGIRVTNGCTPSSEVGLRASSSLSLSLDKGLDEFQLSQRLERLHRAEADGCAGGRSGGGGGEGGCGEGGGGGGAAARGGSEPSLSAAARSHGVTPVADAVCWGCGGDEPEDEARKSFLRRWQEAGGPTPLRADDEQAIGDETARTLLDHKDLDEIKRNQDSRGGIVTEDDVLEAPDVMEPFCESSEQNEVRNSQDDVIADVRNGLTMDKEEEEEEEVVVVGVENEMGEDEIENEALTPEMVTMKLDVMTEVSAGADSGLEGIPPCPQGVYNYHNEEEINGSANGLDVRDTKHESFPIPDVALVERTHGTENSSNHKSEDMARMSSTRRRTVSEAAAPDRRVNVAEDPDGLSMLEVFADSTFASVASRTEALASRAGSFNLVRTRHSSALDD